jgi:hypothetical protein
MTRLLSHPFFEISDRSLEAYYLAQDIEVYDAGIDIGLDETWVNNLIQNKRISLRKVKCRVKTKGGYSFEMNLMSNLGSTYYRGDNIINLGNDTMQDITNALNETMKAWIDKHICTYLTNDFVFLEH